MNEELLFFNGINGSTGEYLEAPKSPQDLSRLIVGQKDEENIGELRHRHDWMTQEKKGVIEDVDPKDLSSSGWGVIFALQDRDRLPAIREALAPLLDLRHEQAAKADKRLYREFASGKEEWEGYQPGDSYLDFLRRHGKGVGPADPQKVPYYLLIVGDPETIPYRFQYQLDVQYAVGRIHFDTLGGYAAYAQSVVAAETGGTTVPRQAAFLGVENPDDRATRLSSQHLVAPLAETLDGYEDWHTRSWVAEEASKARLEELLGGKETPSLLFTASHGMGFGLGDPRQLRHQGALLCSDWPGPERWRERGPIPPNHYFSGDDVASSAQLSGLMAFFFACYGAGTPRLDHFVATSSPEPAIIAPHAFVACLPQRLLGHPKGGALAVVGHVDRARGYSFLWKGAGRQLEVFESTLQRLLKGEPVGWAMEYFGNRYAELSTVLSNKLFEIDGGRRIKEQELAGMWTANNDARSYVVLGDPAVRLPLSTPGEAVADRSRVSLVTPSTPEESVRSQTETPRSEKPIGLSDEDWEQTPPAVKAYIQELETRLRKAQGKEGE